jgi:hypothetical protein
LGLLLFFLSFQAALKASQTIKKENKAFKEKKEAALALNSKNTLTSVTINKSLDNSKGANEANESHAKLARQRRILSERQLPREPK